MLKLLGQIIFGALQINRKLFSNYIFLKSSNYELFQLADSKKLTSLFDHAKNLCTLHLLEVCEKKKIFEWMVLLRFFYFIFLVVDWNLFGEEICKWVFSSPLLFD